MNVAVLLRACVAGVIAGLIGAAAWAAIGHYTGYELAILAWGIGLVVGIAVAAASQDGAGLETGAAALIIAIASVVGGKYAASYMFVQQVVAAAPTDGTPSDEFLISTFADDIIYQRLEAELPFEWPDGVDPDYAEAEADYPPDIWSEAIASWNAMDVDEQAAMREEWTFDSAMMSSTLTMDVFKSSFGFLDIIFLLLAAATAFKVGGGMGDD